MITQPRLLASAAALALFGLTSLAHGKTRADCEKEYTPQRAQEGKDVIWAPTPDAVVLRMLELAKVTPADKLYDLGAGDGKIAIAAGKHFGATAVGVEYDLDLVKHAQCLAEAEGVQARVTFVQGDIFEADFGDATVVALYLTTTVNLRLRPTLLDMKPGTRVVTVFVHDGRLALGPLHRHGRRLRVSLDRAGERCRRMAVPLGERRGQLRCRRSSRLSKILGARPRPCR